jgi:ATP-dependent exoDNAse (exonuclease V) beta subunit
VPTIEDQAVREQALNPERSFIVQAPAGSGKTELLIRRFLRLLARVDTPEAVVAITFTKKAAAEMRTRVLEALRTDAAADVLARDRALGWQLLDNPARLRVQTIDSLCMAITRQMPWVARFGAPPEVTEKSQDMYREAARRTLRTIEDEERAGRHGPLSTLLLHIDNNFARAEELIAQMLERRDQWLRLTGSGPDLTGVRAALEETLREVIEHELTRARWHFTGDLAPEMARQMGWEALPGPNAGNLSKWKLIPDTLLTTTHTVRRRLPCALIDQLEADPAHIEVLRRIQDLPAPCFEDAQWQALEAVVEVLPKAVAHLRFVFRERGRVDFIELSLRALEALGHFDSPSDLALAMGERIEHLLVDEFQDTSQTQWELLEKLTAGWYPGDGHTLFLVGDPMQSIYRFRQAEVGLFLKARNEGIGSVRLDPLTLTSNFRSDPSIVQWVNQTFQGIMPRDEDIDAGAVTYTPSVAARDVASAEAGHAVHAFAGETSAEREASRVLEILEQSGDETVAVLVRARSHLTSILVALRRRKIPFQAIEIDLLSGRAIIQDLLALTFALLHLADRISWLAVLRAPWCGLTLADLHTIAVTDLTAAIWDLLQRKDLPLSPDGAERLARCLPVLADALAQRGRAPLRTVVERAWARLGGPACLRDEADFADVEAFFDLLEGLESSGDLEDFDALRDQIRELYAQPDPRAGERLQIMTVHKAKGLEFDTVILPGLGIGPRREDPSLLLWQEQQGRLLLSPISETGQDNDPIYKYLSRLESNKVEHETARLLYVAATRARKRLHLMGHVQASGKPASGSFLKLLWDSLAGEFAGLDPTLAAAAEATSAPPQRLRRIAAGWTLPDPPAAATWYGDTLEHFEPDPVTFEWVGDTLRHAGDVLHAFFARIATEGLAAWDARRITGLRGSIQTMLRNLGVAAGELDETSSRVATALCQSLRDERGAWILDSHAEAACELPLTGVLDGKVYQVAIDRTFVDEAGVRWIIDYKTSAPEGGDLERFLENEKRRYREQLERYARLMAQQEERPIRLGLYFPLLGGWREWAAPTIKRSQATLNF